MEKKVKSKEDLIYVAVLRLGLSVKFISLSVSFIRRLQTFMPTAFDYGKDAEATRRFLQTFNTLTFSKIDIEKHLSFFDRCSSSLKFYYFI